MPNATVPATAPAMPKTTNRRGALCAVLAAGAVGATAVLPAAASRAVVAPESYKDAALLALLTEARAIEVLEHEIDDAENAAYDRMILPDRPSALNPRPDDYFLFRPRSGEFDEPNIRDLRGLVEDVEKLGPDTKINQALMGELKTRGREIVDAWDSYQAARDGAKEAVDLPAILRRGKELNERRIRLWSQIAATPARTVDGMHAKIAFASIFNLDEREDLVEGTMVDLLVSAAMDYAEIHGQEART
jgi:hypothetical protein